MDRVRVGIIGTSGWSDFMFAPSVRSHPSAVLAAVAGRNPDALAAFADKNHIPRRFTDYREMLTSGEIDAVIVASPDDMHKEMALAALDAGLHVLCEKPLANSLADAELMLARAEASGRRHMVMYTWRWQPHFQYLKTLIDEGYLGRVYRAQFSFIGGWGRLPAYQWRRDASRSNGVLGDLGSHMIDLSRWFLGDVVSVSAHTPTLIDKPEHAPGAQGLANDSAHLTVQYAGCGQGVVDVTTLTFMGDTVDRFLVRLDGDGGSLELDHHLWGAFDGVTIRGGREGDAAWQVMGIPDSYYAGFDRKDVLGPYAHHRAGARLFIDSIVEGFEPEPNFADGVATQRVIEAALRSHRERRWVDLG